jgi:hypothetical protein
MSLAFTRRGLLGASLSALVLGGSGPLLGGCGRASTSEPEPGPYSVWREVQAALRQSPDHSAGRAAALVKAGDIDAIHRFVRDEIRLVSANGVRFMMGNEVRWGHRAALRAGAGTAREKAEILADLIRQTGRTAEVVDTASLSREETRAAFFRKFEQPFNPPVEKKQLSDWHRRLGAASPDAKITDVGDAEAEVSDLSRKLLDVIGDSEAEKLGRYSFDVRPYGDVPMVKVTDPERGALYADPIRPAAVLAPYADSMRERPAEPAKGMLPVTVSLSATTTDAVGEPFEMLRTDWTAEEVAGRQVRFAFKPFGETLSVLASRMGDLRAFTPVAAIQALDGEALDPERAMVMGESVTLEGDRISLDENGDVRLKGENLGDGGPSGKTGEVTTVDVEADASTFPDMTVRVRPRGPDGRIVDGLNVADFALSDEDQPVAHILRTRDRAPRILFLADSSLSMPDEFMGNGPAMQALAKRVEAIAKTIHPKAEIVLRKTDSNLWEHLLKAARSPFNLIVYATDGDLNGREPTEADLAVLKAGPKAIMMNVRGNLAELRKSSRGEDNTFDSMARATNGETVDVSGEDTSAAETAIRRFLEEEGVELPYILSYRVLGAGAGERTASATVGAANAKAPYTASMKAARGLKLASLRLTVKVGDREVTRVLAGHDGQGEVTQSHLDQVQGAMFGNFMLAIEGPPPSLSTVLDDYLAAKLSIETFDRTAARPDANLNTILDVVDAGFNALPGEVATLISRSAQLAGDDYAFAEQGLRCVLHVVRPIMNSDVCMRHVDIMPLDQSFVLSEDKSVLIDKAFEASLSLAAAESILFPVSTSSVLGDTPLAVVDLKRFREAGMPQEQLNEWDRFIREQSSILPHPGMVLVSAEDGATKACWAISRETGAVYALLPNGSGGGDYPAHIQKQLDELDRVIAGLNLLMTAVDLAVGLNPIGAFSLGIVAVYGQNLARMYAAVSLSIILMDASGIEPALKRAMANMSCEITKSLELAYFSGAGKVAARAVTIFTTAENVIGLAGGSTPFSCPM